MHVHVWRAPEELSCVPGSSWSQHFWSARRKGRLFTILELCKRHHVCVGEGEGVRVKRNSEEEFWVYVVFVQRSLHGTSVTEHFRTCMCVGVSMYAWVCSGTYSLASGSWPSYTKERGGRKHTLHSTLLQPDYAIVHVWIYVSMASHHDPVSYTHLTLPTKA